MQITRLSIKNVRAIEHQEINLAIAPDEPRRRLVLLGVNGAGKTTILDAITHAFENLGEPMGMGGVTLGAADVRNVNDPSLKAEDAPRSGGVTLHAVLLQDERRAARARRQKVPAKGELSFIIGDPFDFELDLDDESDLFDSSENEQDPAVTPRIDDVGIDEPLGDEGRASANIDDDSFRDAAVAAIVQQRPPCVFLPADRGVLEEPDDVSLKHIRGFDPCVDCLSRSRERFHPLAARMSLATIDNNSAGHRAVARMWKAVEKYFPEMPKLVSAEGLQLRFRSRRGALVPLGSLSDGERAALLILGEVALRAPSSGVVLIDELEQHLHPRWQEAILHALVALVPSAQFIITTQSPYLAACVPDDLVKLGEWDRDGQ